MGHTWPQFADAQIWDFFMQIAAWPLDVNELKNEKRSLIKSINILGKETSNNREIQLEIYDDGSIEKVYKIK